MHPHTAEEKVVGELDRRLAEAAEPVAPSGDSSSRRRKKPEPETAEETPAAADAEMKEEPS